MASSHWSEKKLKAFHQFCRDRGAEVVSQQGYMNGDIQFMIRSKAGHGSQLIVEFEKEYKGE